MTIGDETLGAEMPDTAAPAPDKRVMGLWATLFFSILTLVVFALLQVVVFIGFVVVKYNSDPAFNFDSFMLDAIYNGSCCRSRPW